MGVQRTAPQILLWVILSGCLSAVVISASAVRRDNYNSVNLCALPGCGCTTKTAWQVINCTFDSKQDVHIGRGDVPSNTLELYINGGNHLTIDTLSFHELNGFSLLRLQDTKTIVINKQAFDNIHTKSVLDLQVFGCNYLLLENKAFKNMLTSIRSEISNCYRVEVRNAVFGRLQEAKLTDIAHLDLKEGAFIFENHTEQRGRHGVVTNISFHNVSIPNIPPRTFVSALSSIEIRDCNIDQIDSHAFAAFEISAILVLNSYIGKLRSGALSERTLIKFFLLRNCKVDLLESQAIMAAITNLTVEFSSIREVASGAVNSSVTANIIISNNKLLRLSPYSFVFRDWNTVLVEWNIIEYLEANFLLVPYNSEISKFSFIANEIHNVEPLAFNCIPELQNRIVHFQFYDNSFNEPCRCGIADWLSTLMNNSYVDYALKSSYCKVNAVIASCFKIQQELISMANYTELVCGPEQDINCAPYNGVTKQITNSTYLHDNDDSNKSKLLLVLVVPSLLILAAVGTFVILLVNGGIWLKKKGYCMRFQYENNQVHNEDEGAMVVDEARSGGDYPELTNEILHELREQLKNPETHDKAREMIEILYERFVIEESYTNNNRQDEEAHLYEELGNMQSGNAANTHQRRADDFLKVMEEKINFPLIDAETGGDYPAPIVNQQYSEPVDAAVHLYSELKTKGDDVGDETAKANSSFASNNGSISKVAFRPLPDKPGEAGPSTKY